MHTVHDLICVNDNKNNMFNIEICNYIAIYVSAYNYVLYFKICSEKNCHSSNDHWFSISYRKPHLLKSELVCSK